MTNFTNNRSDQIGNRRSPGLLPIVLTTLVLVASTADTRFAHAAMEHAAMEHAAVGHAPTGRIERGAPRVERRHGDDRGFRGRSFDHPRLHHFGDDLGLYIYPDGPYDDYAPGYFYDPYCNEYSPRYDHVYCDATP